jgi:signal transduction histidine kinase
VQVEVPEVSDLNLCYPDLVQLLALLLLNAGQATGQGPNDVMVVAAAGAEDVTLTVSDTGVGMDEPTRARALEPFFTTRGVGQGRGLGLSVCHGIVTGAGGEIDLRSGVGSGTTVTVRLPRLVQAGAPAGA